MTMVTHPPIALYIELSLGGAYVYASVLSDESAIVFIGAGNLIKYDFATGNTTTVVLANINFEYNTIFALRQNEELAIIYYGETSYAGSNPMSAQLWDFATFTPVGELFPVEYLPAGFAQIEPDRFWLSVKYVACLRYFIELIVKLC